jgi:peptide/nickel transport system substrate-binding protein
MVHRLSRRWSAVAALGTASLLLAACGTSGGPSTSSTGAVKTGGTLTFALDEDVAGFNVLQATDGEFVLAEILDQVWPSVYVIHPDLKPVLNTEIVSSVKVLSNNPQTIQYNINPKATWSDGVPITAQDFIYNWEAQSGNPKYTDVGGKAYEPASTSGFNQIKSVTSSNGGKTATVVFATPYSDWQSLFAPIIPAHIADKVGFNNGFQTFGSPVEVSGGPYEIQSYSPNEDLVEVRNPHWWGAPGKLSKIVFRFITDDSQQPPAVANDEVNMVNPALASIAFLDSLKGVSNFSTQVDPGLEFQHIDFNESNFYLAQAGIRHALAYGTNRAQLVQRLVDPLTTKIQTLNNHFYMPTQSQYKDNSAGYGDFDPAKAKALLEAAGMKMGSDGYFHPTSGPEKGQDFSLSISTTSGDQVRAEIEELFQADMKNIGVKITVQNYDANTLFGTVGPKGEFDIIEFAWVLTPFASGNQPIYCSYTDTAVCGINWDHYANPTVDKLMDHAIASTSPTTAASLFNQADGLLWKDMVTLPLFEQPQLFGWSNTYGNIQPNTSNIGIPWNAEQWGVRES